MVIDFHWRDTTGTCGWACRHCGLSAKAH